MDTAIFQAFYSFSIALLSMTMVSYALAVPRIQEGLSSLGLNYARKRKDLEDLISKEKVSLKTIEAELNKIKEEGKAVSSIISRLSWYPAVIVPVISSLIAFLIQISIMYYSPHLDGFLIISVAFDLVALVHLIDTLRIIGIALEKTA